MSKEERLRWRLSNLPTVEELRDLVKDKIITQDEAREILFSKEAEDISSLKKEVEVLRRIVQGSQTYGPYQPQLRSFDFWTHFFN